MRSPRAGRAGAAASLPDARRSSCRSRSARSRCGSASDLVGRVTSGGYGYTVERSIAYAYLPVRARRRHRGRGRDLRRVGRGRRRRRAAVRPERRADPRVTFAAEVERVWPGRGARFEVLGGGITNHNLKVEVDGERLRAAGRGEGHRPARDRPRRSSSRRREAAAALGIGPEVVAFVEPEGWLVTRLRRGRDSRRWSGCASRQMLERVAAALRAFHGGPAIPGRVRLVPRRRDLPADTRSSAAGRVPEAYDRGARDRRRGSSRDASADAPVPCHNDLLNANFLDDGERLCIVDWEYAGMGDRFFDLANFSDQPRARRAAERRRCSRRTSATSAPADVAGARAHALHVRLPRGDVGGRAVGRVRARLRLRRLRGRALRAARANGGVAGVRGGARWPERTRGASTAPLALASRRVLR